MIIIDYSCGLDAVLLSTPDYDSSLRLATKAYHVFKYADRPVLQFQCQVTLCLKLDGGCGGITPPKCPETKPLHLNLQNAKRSRRLRKSRSHLNRGVKSGKYEPSDTLDVFTKPVMIVDDQFAELTDCPVFPKSRQNESIMGDTPLIVIASLLALSALNVMLVGAAIAYFCVHRRFSHKMKFDG